MLRSQLFCDHGPSQVQVLIAMVILHAAESAVARARCCAALVLCCFGVVCHERVVGLPPGKFRWHARKIASMQNDDISQHVTPWNRDLHTIQIRSTFARGRDFQNTFNE